MPAVDAPPSVSGAVPRFAAAARRSVPSSMVMPPDEVIEDEPSTVTMPAVVLTIAAAPPKVKACVPLPVSRPRVQVWTAVPLDVMLPCCTSISPPRRLTPPRSSPSCQITRPPVLAVMKVVVGRSGLPTWLLPNWKVPPLLTTIAVAPKSPPAPLSSMRISPASIATEPVKPLFDDVNVVRPLPDCTIAPEPEIDSPKLRPSVWSKRIVPAWLTTNPAAMVGAGPPAAIESVPPSIVATDARLPATIDAEPPATVSPPPIEPFRSVKPPEPPTVRGAAMVTAVDPSPASTAPPDTAMTPVEEFETSSVSRPAPCFTRLPPPTIAPEPPNVKSTAELSTRIEPGATSPASDTLPATAESSKMTWSPATKFVATVDDASSQLRVPPTSTAVPASQVDDRSPTQRTESSPVMSRSMVVLVVS